MGIRIGLATVILSIVWQAGPLMAQSGGGVAGLPQSGRALYQTACANCHGEDGRGAPQSRVAFDIGLPDFSDCNFATREADADWLAVSHQGGPARAFSEMMPAFGEALSIEQLQRILDYLRGFCSSREWPRGELNLPRPLVTEKAYPEDEAVFSAAVSTEGRGSFSNEFIYERRFGARNQLEVIIPFGWQDTDAAGAAVGSQWEAGLGDVALGAKRAVFHSLEKGAILSVGGEVIFPTGDEEKGFGKGSVLFEPFASYGQILPSDFFLHVQAGMELPADSDKAEKEAFWRAAVGRTFSAGQWGRSFSPLLEVLGARELERGGESNWDLVPQLQVSLNRRQHILVSLGVRLPVNNTQGRDTQILFYLLWDWFDGGFLDGW